jgi:hypothetical protein
LSPKSPFLKVFEDIFLYSWWVILFCLLCYMWLEHENKKHRTTFQELSSSLLELKNEKIVASRKHQQLLNQINSQSDPAWVELTLLKGLGLVPENHIKIYFPENHE